jgi:hypothetical protein
MNIERTQEIVATTPEVDWQTSDMQYDEIRADWAETLDRLYR